MKKIRKSLMVISLILSLTTQVFALETGKCGENVSWEQNDAGILTISGSGRMEDYEEIETAYGYGPSYTSSPFDDLPSTGQLVIGDGVTYIGNYSFYKCQFVSLELSDTVMSIGNSAFMRSAVSDITFNEGLINIGASAFSGCHSLPAIELPDSVQTLGDNAFYNSSTLMKASLGSGIKNIGSQAFRACYSLKTIEIGDKIKTIGSGAFQDCRELSDVYYAGSEADWKKIVIGANNEPLLNAKIHYNSSVGNDSSGDVAPTQTEKKDSIKVFVDNIQVFFDQEPIIINDRVMVPIRAVAEAMGDTVEWHADINAALIIHADRVVGFKTNNTTVPILKETDDDKYHCDVPAQNINGRILTPLRAIGESLDAKVEWDGKTKTVKITSAPSSSNTLSSSMIEKIRDEIGLKFED